MFEEPEFTREQSYRRGAGQAIAFLAKWLLKRSADLEDMAYWLDRADRLLYAAREDFEHFTVNDRLLHTIRRQLEQEMAEQARREEHTART